jgi:putative serine protease PepD
MSILQKRAGRGAVALTAIVVSAQAGLSGCGQDSGTPAAEPAQAGPVSTMQSPFASLQQQFEQVVRAVSPQVVQIQSPRGLGSGVVFDDRANVVTNAHVVAGARQFVVTLSGGQRHPATLVGSDPSHDLAVVHVSGATPAPATFADSSKAQVGDLVLAIGNPLGLRSSVTQGIVSSLNRSVSEGHGVSLSSAIQTSAAINPGNSGGALVDLTGRVIGIPTLEALDPELGDTQAAGIGFAIPSNSVRNVVTSLIVRAGAQR